MKNKGETLIELILSMFIFTNILIPLTELYIRICKNNNSINNKILKRRTEKNILEYIKSFSSEKMLNLECENLKFENLKDLLVYLSIENEVEQVNGEYILTIRDNYMRFGILEDYKSYDIILNEEKEIYIPK